MEFLAAYDLDIMYTPGKANVVANALSRKPGMLASLVMTPPLIERIADKQKDDEFIKKNL